VDRGIFRKVLLTVLVSVFIYIVLLFYADTRKVGAILRDFDPKALLILLNLSFLCYLTRTLRLLYLMRLLKAKINFNEALYLQFSGMIMTITPGKLGEVFKAFLARELVGFSAGKGVALVFVERLTDLAAVILLSLGGLMTFKANFISLGILIFLTAIITVLFSTNWFRKAFLSLLSKTKYAERFKGSFNEMFATIRTYLNLKPLLISIILAIIGWGSEGIAFYLTLKELDFGAFNVFQAISVYTVSTIAGALAMLPGGIGLTEGSMIAILMASGATRYVSFAATMIIRFTTLWFGVISGWLVFLFAKRDITKKMLEKPRSDLP
jgi:uncharacterized protein (TIRG00374 family)